MNLSSRLTFALITVVVIVVSGHVLYSVYFDFRSTRTLAASAVANVRGPRLNTSLTAAQDQTQRLVDSLLRDQRFLSAYDGKNKGEAAASIRAAEDKLFFPGSVQVTDEKGIVFFSTETPNQSGYSLKAENTVIDLALAHDFYKGPTFSEKTGVISISTVKSFSAGGRKGILAVNQPLNSDFLTALAARFGIEDPNVLGVELAVYSEKIKTTTAFSQGIKNLPGPMRFLLDLNGHDASKVVSRSPLGTGIPQLDHLIVPANGFEKEGAWWMSLPLESDRVIIGYVLVCKPVPNEQSKLVEVLLLGGLVGVFGGLVGLFLAAKIAQSVDTPLRFLVKRTQAIANNKQVIPPLEGLSGDWLELGELIDTAVLSMRSTTQNLKIQLNKQVEAVKERGLIAEQSTQQVDTLNRQITTQAQKVAELSRHVNQAGRQATVLQQQLDAVLQSSTEGFLILDQYGNILHANPVFLNWTGMSEGEIAGRLCFDLVLKPGETPQSHGMGQAFTQHGGDPMALINQFYPEGVIFQRASEKTVQVLAHLQPLSGDDGSIMGYIMVLRDKSLRSENQLLRQEIVSMLQDNIRGPLTGAELSWQAILANARNTMHPSVGQALAELHLHYSQLVGVVDSLLMMYGGFVPPPAAVKEQINITRVVADCLEEVTPLARDRQLLLDYKTVTGLPPILGNREAIIGILRQVLERMIMVTAAGGRVRVESQVRGNEMRIGVSSSGPALPESEIAEMFVGFIEGKHTQDTYGSRLAMYLARSNVERLGGLIWAESEAGRGTTTYFTMPIT
ncbi:MAG: PAS domain-containing protein [Candidatus Melainabacteria bacterium]|nr:PAS domain-containing protein [Candidatus Melainabacteria bacterium]